MFEAVTVIVAMFSIALRSVGNTPHFSGVFFATPHFRGHDEGDAMIEDICMSKRVVADLRQGPLGPFLDQLGEHLERSHDRQGARRVLLCAGRLAAFAGEHGRDPSSWGDELLIDFLLTGDVAVADAFRARDVREALTELGIFTAAESPPAGLRLLVDYDEHLRDVRGISKGVRIAQADVVRQVLAFHRRRHGDAVIGTLNGKDAIDLFQETGERYRCVATRQKFAGFFRQVLRFLHLRGHIEQDLASTVPLFVNYRLSTVPDHLAWEDVRKLAGRGCKGQTSPFVRLPS